MPRKQPPDPRLILLEMVDQAFDKRSWHGPNLIGAIQGVNAMSAARRVKGRKTIWEQLLHAAYWKQRVVNKLTRTSTRLPRRGSNWPAMPVKPSNSAWRADVALLHEVHGRLRAAMEQLPASRIDVKTRWLIQGAAAHDLYHAGQIKLLRRLVGEA